MNSYLLTWNPKYLSEEKFDEYYSRYERGKVIRWSCGNTKKISPDDTFYFLKQGKGNTGIIGSGVIVTSPYNAAHYDDEKASKGQTALYVDVKFKYLAHPNASIPIQRDELQSTELRGEIWNTQRSGNSIPSEFEEKLTELWLNRVKLK